MISLAPFRHNIHVYVRYLFKFYDEYGHDIKGLDLTTLKDQMSHVSRKGSLDFE